PKNWEKTYFEWMYNIQDWCISRQIWWGHRIPAWYDEENNIYVGNSEQEIREKNNLSKETKLRQDEDVLDTWFSSALWPFSTLGWPEDSEDLSNYYPTSLLVVGFDIIFFWVARMIMMGINFQKDIPFKDILVHGLVRDSKGRKMSKSLGNTIDPLELSDKHGADALRFSLVEKASPGQDVPFDEEWTIAAKKFGNKIWNASKFVHIYTDGKETNDLSTIECEENKWIINKFDTVLDEFNSLFEKYKISDAYKLLYNFLWSDLFDWYFEFSKNLIENENHKSETMEVLHSVFLKSIKILNPAMPHITEEVWETFDDEVLISNKWPEKYNINKDNDGSVEDLKNLISKIRNFKATYQIKNNTKLKIYSDVEIDDWFKSQFESLAKVEIQKDTYTPKEGEAVLHFHSGNYDFVLSAEEYIDIEVEIKKLNKKINEIEKSIEISNKRLENEKFMKNAKPELIDEEKSNKEALEIELSVIQETLKELGN
ncbi:MAG: class I tRNA ligase family protein, partial [Actinomycetota bacterium]|nr:class I tRNA ligase family protein [Actinomycetota bacterium]